MVTFDNIIRLSKRQAKTKQIYIHETFINLNKIMVKFIDFYADWCAPCKVMTPVIEEIRKEYEGKITLEEIDVDANQPLTNQYGVLSIPTYLILKDDQEVGRLVGVNPKARLVEVINQALA